MRVLIENIKRRFDILFPDDMTLVVGDQRTSTVRLFVCRDIPLSAPSLPPLWIQQLLHRHLLESFCPFQPSSVMNASQR